MPGSGEMLLRAAPSHSALTARRQDSLQHGPSDGLISLDAVLGAQHALHFC